MVTKIFIASDVSVVNRNEFRERRALGFKSEVCASLGRVVLGLKVKRVRCGGDLKEGYFFNSLLDVA